MTVWLYWEGKMPPYIRLCMDLLLAYNPTARLIGPQDLEPLGFPKDFLEAINRWHICQKSDAIRTWLLAHYGGLWCDADCIPLRSFDLLMRCAESSPAGLLAYDSTDHTIGVGLLAATAHSEAILRMWDHVMTVARSGRMPRWLEVSSEPMTRIVHEIGRENFPILPFSHVCPVSWQDQQRWSDRASDAEFAAWLAAYPCSWTLMLCNQRIHDPNAVPEAIPELTRHELLTSDRRLSFAFRESIHRWYERPMPSGRAVVTLNLYGDGMPHHFRQSHKAAAARWGAEYVEITRPLFGWREPWWEKLNLDKHTAAYDRVVYVDRDVVIREDCPNLFDVVPEETIGAVLSEQDGHRFHDRIASKMAALCHLLNTPLNVEKDYLNSGVLVFSPECHRQVFEAARLIWSLTGDHSSWEISDQGSLSLAIQWTKTPLRILPPAFNRCGAKLWNHWTPQMDDYIWHFCGSKNWDHMDRTEWNKCHE